MEKDDEAHNVNCSKAYLEYQFHPFCFISSRHLSMPHMPLYLNLIKMEPYICNLQILINLIDWGQCLWGLKHRTPGLEMEPRFKDHSEGSVSEHLWTQVSLYQVVHECLWEIQYYLINLVLPLWYDHGSYISDILSCTELNLIYKQCCRSGSGSGIRIQCLFDPQIQGLGSGIRDGKKSRSGSRITIPDHISESLETICWVKNAKIL